MREEETIGGFGRRKGNEKDDEIIVVSSPDVVLNGLFFLKNFLITLTLTFLVEKGLGSWHDSAMTTITKESVLFPGWPQQPWKGVGMVPYSLVLYHVRDLMIFP